MSATTLPTSWNESFQPPFFRQSTEDTHVQKDDPEVVARLRCELEEATGFGSYKAYVESLAGDPMYPGPYPHDLDRFLKGDDVDKIHRCDIFEVSMGKDRVPQLTLRGHHLSATQTCAAIRNPPRDISLQTILWQTGRYTRVSYRWADLLGLALKLDPLFLEALADEQDIRSNSEERGYNRDTRARSAYVFLSGLEVWIEQHSGLNAKDSAPIVFIAGDCRDELGKRDEIYEMIRVNPSSIHSGAEYSKATFSLDLIYIRLLAQNLEQYRDSVDDIRALLICCLLPLLHMDTMPLKDHHLHVRRLFRKLKRQSLDGLSGDDLLDYIGSGQCSVAI